MSEMTIREKHLTVLNGLRERLRAAPIGVYEDKTSPAHMLNMINIAHREALPDDKLARWTGFIQGVMAARGWLSVDAERDRTRPVFT